LPFSHAAEKELLPKGVRHEHLSKDHILGEHLKPLFGELKIGKEDVAKLAVGPKYYSSSLSVWESILYEMIGGNVFGADRIDYLLRDSFHSGVSYGRFDHMRLIETMRILPREDLDSEEPDLGITVGGLQTAESLLWARYFMYTQLYFHPVRRIYDIHLKEFLAEWLADGRFSVALKDHLAMTDNEVLSGILQVADDSSRKGHNQARRIVDRRHFRLLYESNPVDVERNLKSVELVYEAARLEFGDDAVRHDPYESEGGSEEFPVYLRDGAHRKTPSERKLGRRKHTSRRPCTYWRLCLAFPQDLSSSYTSMGHSHSISGTSSARFEQTGSSSGNSRANGIGRA
jgi:hypothetical protein